MSEKIKVALIYCDCFIMDIDHYDNCRHHFFHNALKRNEKFDVTYFPSGETFDATGFDEKFDAILLPFNGKSANYTINSCVPKKIIGIQKLKISIIAMNGDAQNSAKFDIKARHENYKIDCYFDIYPSFWFYKFYPKDYKYKTVYSGLESSLYQNLTPFNSRIKNKILNSSNTVNTYIKTKTFHRLFKRHGSYTLYDFYKLRSDCNLLPYIDYTHTFEHRYIGNNYPKLLQKYAASIAATSVYPTIKYFEIPAAGCLTFMEVTSKNHASA